MIDRRRFLRATGVALGACAMSSTVNAASPKKRLLVFTRSAGFQHPVVTVKDGKQCIVDRLMTEFAAQAGVEVECTKDGRVFLPESLAKFDAFFFFTTGDLTAEKSEDGMPPMPREGKQALLDAVAAGKGFLGSHCAADTFHSPGTRRHAQDMKDVDAYLRMLGGEFIEHGEIQNSTLRVVDGKFPGVDGVGDQSLNEEWYGFKNYADDLHVILAQDTKGMKGVDYERPGYPSTWARMHGQGRVFYTSLGHKPEIWEQTPFFRSLMVGAIRWATRQVDADVTPNLLTATPEARTMPPFQKPVPMPKKK